MRKRKHKSRKEEGRQGERGWKRTKRSTLDDGRINRLGGNDLHIGGRTEMDEIAQSESYKRTSLCYLEEGRRLLQRKWELGDGGNGGSSSSGGDGEDGGREEDR